MPSRPGHPLGTLVAWVIIAAIVLAVAIIQNRPATTATGEADDSIALLVLEVQGRYFFGAASLVPAQSAALVPQLRQLETGSIGQRLRVAALAGEVGAASDALDAIDRIDALLLSHSIELAPEWSESMAALRRLYEAKADATPDAPDAAEAVLDDAQRTDLVDRLGWFGELAVTAPDSSRRAELQRSAIVFVVIVVGLICALLALGLAGFVGVILFAALWLARPQRFGISVPTGPYGLLAETFAVWLLLFALLPQVLGALTIGAGAAAKMGLALTLFAFAASLVALAWPSLRGERWATVCRDIGLHRGRGVVVECACGIGTYAMALPLVAAGLVLFLALSGAMAEEPTNGNGDPLAPGGVPAHPIIEMVAAGDVTARILILLLACVAAPVVEEIMFRGVLHRHLRGMTRGAGILVSAATSALVVGFIFAVVHPQGLAAVPLLTAMAIGFSIGREWRDSLIAPMVAHGLNNLVVILLMFAAFG